MKDIISILEENENNQLDLWFDLDDKGTERLLNKVLNYALENPDKVKSYCSNIIPQKYSSLSIVYEALSRNHREWGAFLHDEIVRIVDLVERKEIPSSCLSVLNAIDVMVNPLCLSTQLSPSSLIVPCSAQILSIANI